MQIKDIYIEDCSLSDKTEENFGLIQFKPILQYPVVNASLSNITVRNSQIDSFSIFGFMTDVVNLTVDGLYVEGNTLHEGTDALLTIKNVYVFTL